LSPRWTTPASTGALKVSQAAINRGAAGHAMTSDVFLYGCLSTCVLLTGALDAGALSAEPQPAAMHSNDGAVVVPAGVPQLFVDDYLIAEQTGLRRTLRQPKKDFGGDSPLLELEGEFGDVAATLEANGSILYDPRLRKWIMYAVAYASSLDAPDRTRVYRFTSPDAIHWIKGDDGSPQHVHFELVDAATGRKAANTDVFSCHYDDTDPQYPYKGWLWFAKWGGLEGLYFVKSADGIKWLRGARVAASKTRRIRQGGRHLEGPGDVTVFCRDPARGKFLAAIKFYDPNAPADANGLRSRAYAEVDVLDRPLPLEQIKRVALAPAAADAQGDRPSDEYYGSTAWRYGPLYLGGLKVWHGRDDYPHSSAGCAFLKLAVSRDGLSWSKIPFANDSGTPEVWLANGPEGGRDGRNDGGYITEFSQGLLRIGDELILYYGASSWGKNQPAGRRLTGGGVFRARLRPDGFVSVDGGSMTTVPLLFEGAQLHVNAVGPIEIVAYDMAGRVLGRAAISGDSLRHNVNFVGWRLNDSAAHLPVQLRFTIGEGGVLYSFTAS